MELKGRKKYAYVCVGTIIIGLLAYFNVIKGFFLSDDFVLLDAIVNNGALGVWTFKAGFFRPIISLSLFWDHGLYGLNATGYHVTNIVIHAFNAFFVFLLTNEILRTHEHTVNRRQQHGISLFASLIFLVLPSHTEAVSWISGRTDLIATFFCLSSFGVYLLSVQARARSVSVVACSLMLFMLALLSKESVITYPVMLAGYEISVACSQKKPLSRQWSRFTLPLYYAFMLLVFIGIRWAAVGAFLGGYGSSIHLAIRPAKFLFYAIFFALRAYLPPFSMHVWYVILPLLLMSGLVGLIFFARRTRLKGVWRKIPPLVYFLIAAFFITLLPGFTLGIMPMDTRGERILYLPSVFSSILLAYVVVKILYPHRKILWGASLGLLVFFQLGVYHSNTHWDNGGEIAKRILLDLQATELSNVAIVNLPDNLRGAYIYRNGIQQAMSFFFNRKPQVTVFSYQYLQAPDDNVVVTQQSDPHSYRLQLENPAAYFVNIDLLDDEYVVTDTVVEGFRRYPKDYTFYFKEQPAENGLYFYSAGHLHAVRSRNL